MTGWTDEKEVKTVDDNGGYTDWQDNVYIGIKYTDHCEGTLDPQAEFKQT